MKRNFFLAIILILVSAKVFSQHTKVKEPAQAIAIVPMSQPAKVLAGPMLGYMEHREALIWIQTICCKKITLQYSALATPKLKTEISITNPDDSICKQAFIAKFIPTNLTMGTTYEYKILLDGKEQKFSYPLKFKTKYLWEWRTDPPEFSFLTGSCNYVNDSIYDRPGKPYGQGTSMFWRMADVPADFMLWLGDNAYLREADYSTENGIAYRYRHTRSDKNLQKLLAMKNNYAIWDDHDYGDNNSGKGFPMKETSYKNFKEYWGNKMYGESNEGIYSTFSYSDADFILLDNRWWRDETDLNEEKNPNKTQLGEKQMQWFLFQLAHSKATFKFVCVGGQFLNEHTNKESFNLFKNERQRIIDYIIANKISGVIFISGDRHLTEMLEYNKRKTDLGYSLFELTSSALSSSPEMIADTAEEFNNPMRIKNSLVMENNYCVVSLSGKKGMRKVKFSCFDKDGAQKWEYEIGEEQLKALK